jgi:hypothetical protein
MAHASWRFTCCLGYELILSEEALLAQTSGEQYEHEDHYIAHVAFRACWSLTVGSINT